MACNIVHKAHEMGLYVIVTDQFPESPAKKVADEHYMVSTYDIDGLVKLAKEHKVNGIITGYIDSILPYYQKVCDILNLPCYATEEQIKIANNKDLFKETCKKYNVPIVPQYKIDKSLNNIDSINIEYPVIVKPVDNSASRGISVCYNKDELIVACKKAISFSKRETFIVEKFIDAVGINVEYHLNNGEILLETIMEKRVNKFEDSYIFLPSVFLYPSTFITRYKEEVNDLVINMFKELGMKNGTLFMSAFVTPDEILFHEMGYRLGGAMAYKYVEACCNYSPMELLINFAINGVMSNSSLKEKVDANYNGNVCVELIPTLKLGDIESILGLKDVESLKEVIHIEQKHFVGDSVNIAGSYDQILARILMLGDIEKLINNINFINKKINVVNTKGNNQILNVYKGEDLYEWYEKRRRIIK